MIQALRGTKDILPDEIETWHYIYQQAQHILDLSNYEEIRTPLMEHTSLFERSIGNNTDIINKEMYSFIDQGSRNITLRPEGTASIARAFISNKMHHKKKIQRLWYLGPMFRYERPQQGRQRQFHQLGIECLGSNNPLADAEVIRLAILILKSLEYETYSLEINSIGNAKERHQYKEKLVDYLEPYMQDLDIDSQKRLYTNPLRILDTKDYQTQEILSQGPKLQSYLNKDSLKHFHQLCQHLHDLHIKFSINHYLVRGLDYYNYTAFEIKNNFLGQQNTICGGGRYDQLIEQLGGPRTPAVGWAIGIERLILTIANTIKNNKNTPIYIAIQGSKAYGNIWHILQILEQHNIRFELDLSNLSFYKQIKKANALKSEICLIIGDQEIEQHSIIIKWLNTGKQKNIDISQLSNYLYYIKKYLKS